MSEDDEAISWEDLKELNKKGLKSKFFPGYVFNKWLMRGALFLCLSLLFLVAWKNDFKLGTGIYIECPENHAGLCENPFYEKNLNFNQECPDPSLCMIDKFMPGESWGEKPDPLIGNYPLFVALIFFATFILNHYLYNRGVQHERNKIDSDDHRRREGSGDSRGRNKQA